MEKWSGREDVPIPPGEVQYSRDMLEGAQWALDHVVVYPTRHPSWCLDTAVRPTAHPHLDPSGDTSFTSQGFPRDPRICSGRNQRAAPSLFSRCHCHLVYGVKTRGTEGSAQEACRQHQALPLPSSLRPPGSILIHSPPRKLGKPAQYHSVNSMEPVLGPGFRAVEKEDSGVPQSQSNHLSY